MLHIADSFVAQVTFLAPNAGGRQRPARSPMVSQLALAGVQVTCHVVAIDEHGKPLEMGELALGRPFRARVVVDHAAHYASELKALERRIELYEGSKKVASGVMEASVCLETTPADVEQFIRERMQ